MIEMVMVGGVNHNDYLRVEVNHDGTFNIADFTLPSSGAKLRRHVPQSDVPKWIMESISMLRIANEGDHIDHLGLKVSDHAYYIYDRTGETDG